MGPPKVFGYNKGNRGAYGMSLHAQTYDAAAPPFLSAICNTITPLSYPRSMLGKSIFIGEMYIVN